MHYFFVTFSTLIHKSIIRMKKHLKTDEWNIIEEGFHANKLRESESIFSLGNGRFGNVVFLKKLIAAIS